MKIAWFAPAFLDPIRKELDKRHVIMDAPKDTDGFHAVLLMSVSQMNKLAPALRDRVPLFVYNWDVYDWALNTPRDIEYNWGAFKNLCLGADEVWVPSVAEQTRYKKWTRRDSVIVPSFVPFEQFPDHKPKDGRFVLDTLRHTPDPFWGLAESVCDELGIPLVTTKHRAKMADYTRMLAECTMCISTLREASTGGLGLVEAAWYGKPVLVPDNPENAGKEYVPWAHTFKSGDKADLKRAIMEIWDKPKTVRKKTEIRERYSAKVMADAINERLLQRFT